MFVKKMQLCIQAYFFKPRSRCYLHHARPAYSFFWYCQF